MNIYYDVEDNHYRTYPDGDIATIDQMRELVENKNLSIVKLQQENKILKENAENNDKVVDKVNWENMLLKKENKQLKDNWNKLKEWVNKHYDYYMNNEDYIGGRLCFTDMKDIMQEIEESDSSEKDN